MIILCSDDIFKEYRPGDTLSPHVPYEEVGVLHMGNPVITEDHSGLKKMYGTILETIFVKCWVMILRLMLSGCYLVIVSISLFSFLISFFTFIYINYFVYFAYLFILFFALIVLFFAILYLPLFDEFLQGHNTYMLINL